MGFAVGLPERSGGLNPYKLTPKMFWRLNKIASDKRKLLESGEKTGFWLKRTFFASVSYGFILSSLKSIRRILLTSF